VERSLPAPAVPDERDVANPVCGMSHARRSFLAFRSRAEQWARHLTGRAADASRPRGGSRRCGARAASLALDERSSGALSPRPAPVRRGGDNVSPTRRSR
jgi:hypothetical protein